MPSNDVILLGYRPRSEIQASLNLRRALSDDRLLESVREARLQGPVFSMLKLSKTRISVGDSVTVYWDVREQCGANDWIGLFDLDGPTSLSNYLDCKQRGVTGAKRGAIKWAINRDVTLGEVENKCIFKYIHGNNSSVKAISPTLYIYNPYAELASPHGRPRLGSLVSQETLLEFSIAGIQANGLKKNIFGKPSPYVKLSIMPSRRHLRSWKQHHGQIAKTSSQTNTINPKWSSEEFVFLGGADDILEVEVRNKFSGTRPAFSRFLGKLTVPLVTLFECQRNRPEECTKTLVRRTPADRVQGTLALTITVIEPSSRPAAASAEQENVPPALPSRETSTGSPQPSNPTCTLSNSSLMSSAPNILQPLTLNSSNGVLETIFPVDTPSPLSPHGRSEEGRFGDAANCRRRLDVQPRPYSELYSEEFVPLDDVNITNPELPQNSQAANDDSTLSGNDSTEGGSSCENRTSSSLANSVDIESTDDTVIDQGQNSHIVVDDTDGISSLEASATLTPTQGPGDNNQDSENQPMEIPEETNNANSSEVEMSSTNAVQRSSTGSIELTEDSPLRILEESERTREERIALSSENLLQDPTAESDDELEQMDVTDETITTERNNSDHSMDDVLTGGNVTQSALNGSSSTENQPLPERETDLLEDASSSLLDEEVHDAILSSLEDLEGSRASPPVVECLPGPSVTTVLIEPETGADEMTAEVNLQSPAENIEHNSTEHQEIGARGDSDELMSLLEYVDQIMVDEPESAEPSGENAMIIEPVGGSTQVGTSSPGSDVGTSEAAGMDSFSVAESSVTLPMEASEPVCLGATSVQETSTSEMIVDSPLAVHSGVSNDERAVPQRPPRDKRLSRSSSDPRSAHSRRLAERSRNASRGSNQGEDSARLSRPPLVRRVTEPTTMETTAVNPAVVPVNTGALSQASITTAVVTPVTEPVAAAAVLSPTESVVMAVPLSPLQLRSSVASVPSPVVVADVVAEAPALVTPLPSPDSVGNRTNSTSDEQSAVVAVSLEASARAAGEASTSRDSPDDYVLMVPSDGRQPSSAPSTLTREAASAVDSLWTNGRRTSHRRNSSQDSSSVIYATPLSGLGRESADQQCASFPRPSSTARVTALSGNRRRSSSSSGYTVTRSVPDESQSLPRSYGQSVATSSSSAAVVAASATANSEQVRDNATEGVTNPSNGAASLPGPSSQSGSDLSPSREAIQTMLRSYYIKSTQVPGGPPPAIRPPRVSSSSAQEPEAARRPSQPNNRSGNRRSSGRRQQGNPVHVSIQDQQQSRDQQAQPEQQAAEEEPLPPNWERGVDSHGRVYYIDHVNRTTTWNRPRTNAPESESNMNEINTHWQSLDRRYQSFRRTLRGRSSRHSRVPLPMVDNRESQTTGESSASGSADTASASPRPSHLPATSASSSPVASTSSTPSASPAPSTSTAPSTFNPLPPASLPSTSSEPSSSSGPSTSSASSSRNSNHLQSPAVKFLTRHDLIDFLKSKGVAGHYYFQSQMLKLIVSKIRSEPSQFERYRHQVELVRFLNQFADPQMDMPAGWDKKVDQSGRLYFIDHTSRTTTFIDPRLPVEETLPRRNRSETEPRRGRVPPPRPPPPRTPSRSSSLTNSTPMTYNQQVVSFLSQPNIDDILKDKYQGYSRSPTLKANVRRVQTEGERALARMSNNLDFIMLLSVMEESIVSHVPAEIAQTTEPTSQSSSPSRHSPNPQATPGTRSRSSSTEVSLKGAMGDSTASSSPAPYKRDFEAKVRSFHRQLYHKGYGQGPNKIKLSIRRDHILEDAYDQIMKEPARAIQRNRLEIQFAGEEGLDYGGPAREFFFLLSRQVFNPYYGLFEYSANDTYTVQVSPVSLYVDNSHEWFRFCGRIVGLVIIHQHLLDAFFTRPFYKALLRSPCDLSDVEAMDSLFHQSMTWLTENDITGVLDLSFTVSEEIFGQVTERELIPGGKEIEVTESNKHEYVEQMVRWRVERGVAEQMESIVNGFNEVLDPNLINLFDARELELVISGTADIDIEDWRKNTEYRSGYHGNHKVIKWFWKVVRSFDNEQKLRLLQFVTGTSSIPYEGFAALRGSTGPRKFCIERWGDFSKLPRAHTCFNRLDLPLYRSYEELLEKLTFAVEESETFAMQ